jgi:predicted RNase H-like nuclease (RuvC/YqgF family)
MLPPLDFQIAAPKKPALPGLNFSKLKQVKETDWYSQSQKLEKVIVELREKLDKVTEEKENLLE